VYVEVEDYSGALQNKGFLPRTNTCQLRNKYTMEYTFRNLSVERLRDMRKRCWICLYMAASFSEEIILTKNNI
jgi:hypothetical protein